MTENNDRYSEEALQERLTKVYLKENGLSEDMEDSLKSLPFTEREEAAKKYKDEQDKKQRQEREKEWRKQISGSEAAKRENERNKNNASLWD